MSNGTEKLELALLEMKHEWYEKLQKKLFMIENGNLKLEDYSKEIMDKIFEMRMEIAGRTSGLNEDFSIENHDPAL